MVQNQQYTSGGTLPDNKSANDLSALADTAKAKLGEVTEPIKDKAVEIAEHQKDVGADQVGHFAQAMHGAASALEQQMPQFANYVHDAGQKLEGLADDLRNGSVDELLDRFGRYAKDQPALIFGGAMIAGFALTRFLKSSAKTPHMADLGMSQGGTA